MPAPKKSILLQILQLKPRGFFWPNFSRFLVRFVLGSGAVRHRPEPVLLPKHKPCTTPNPTPNLAPNLAPKCGARWCGAPPCTKFGHILPPNVVQDGAAHHLAPRTPWSPRAGPAPRHSSPRPWRPPPRGSSTSAVAPPGSAHKRGGLQDCSTSKSSEMGVLPPMTRQGEGACCPR